MKVQVADMHIEENGDLIERLGQGFLSHIHAFNNFINVATLSHPLSIYDEFYL